MSHYPSNSILIQYLIDRIRDSAKAAIPFSALMESCLYHPEGGYYMSSRPKIGKAGDFYTSSNVGSAMGEMIAVYIQRQAAEAGRRTRSRSSSGERATAAWPDTSTSACAAIAATAAGMPSWKRVPIMRSWPRSG